MKALSHYASAYILFLRLCTSSNAVPLSSGLHRREDSAAPAASDPSEAQTAKGQSKWSFNPLGSGFIPFPPSPSLQWPPVPHQDGSQYGESITPPKGGHGPVQQGTTPPTHGGQGGAVPDGSAVGVGGQGSDTDPEMLEDCLVPSTPSPSPPASSGHDPGQLRRRALLSSLYHHFHRLLARTEQVVAPSPNPIKTAFALIAGKDARLAREILGAADTIVRNGLPNTETQVYTWITGLEGRFNVPRRSPYNKPPSYGLVVGVGNNTRVFPAGTQKVWWRVRWDNDAGGPHVNVEVGKPNGAAFRIDLSEEAFQAPVAEVGGQVGARREREIERIKRAMNALTGYERGRLGDYRRPLTEAEEAPFIRAVVGEWTRIVNGPCEGQGVRGGFSVPAR